MTGLTKPEYQDLLENLATDNYLAELNNLEQYIQMQPWYQELEEAFAPISQKKTLKNV